MILYFTVNISCCSKSWNEIQNCTFVGNSFNAWEVYSGGECTLAIVCLVQFCSIMHNDGDI